MKISIPVQEIIETSLELELVPQGDNVVIRATSSAVYPKDERELAVIMPGGSPGELIIKVWERELPITGITVVGQVERLPEVRNER